MSSLYPDVSYCTSELGRLLFQAKTDYTAVCRVSDVREAQHLGVKYTEYQLTFTLTRVGAHVDTDERVFTMATRFKEMSRLHALLSRLHKQLYLRGVFPAFPAGKWLHAADPSVVEERRHATDAVMAAVCDSEVLRKARCVHEFVDRSVEESAGAEVAGPDSFLYEAGGDILDAPLPSSARDGEVLTPSPTPDEADQEEEEEEPSWLAGRRDTVTSVNSDFEFPAPSMRVGGDGRSRGEEESVMRRLYKRFPLGRTNTQTGDEQSSRANLVQAGQLISTAHRAEQERAFHLAFHCYKNAASLLITAVDFEEDTHVRNAMRRKTAKYLVKAERLYRDHLSLDGSILHLDALFVTTRRDPAVLAFQSSPHSLKDYIVEGRPSGLFGGHVDSRVYVVREKATGVRLVMKLLEKPCSSEPSPFLPTQVPHMVPLHKFFETEMLVILLLDYVETGELWEFLVPYFCECERRHCKSLAVEFDPVFRQDYRGRHESFSVGIDYERVADMTERGTEDENGQDATPVLCSMGVDAAESAGAGDGQAGDFFLSGRDIAMTEAQPYTIDEEPPARLNFTARGAGGGGAGGEIDSLPLALSECSRRLATRSRCWHRNNTLPECLIAHWTAQLASMLYVLHEQGAVCGELSPSCLLICPDGNICTTYGAWWSVEGEEGGGEETGRRGRRDKMTRTTITTQWHADEAAPELHGALHPATAASDVWSLGVILFHLLAGRPLYEAAPHGVGRYTELPLLPHVSLSASDLLQRILREDPSERAGLDEIRAHPFYSTIDWQLYDNPRATVRREERNTDNNAFHQHEVTSSGGVQSDEMPSCGDVNEIVENVDTVKDDVQKCIDSLIDQLAE